MRYRMRLKIKRVMYLIENQNDLDLVNEIYAKMKRILKAKIKEILLVRNLRRYWKKPKIQLSGVISFHKDGTATICVDSSDNTAAKTKTLVHELLHYIFHNEEERQIVKLENLLWDKLSQRQKNHLKKWIPDKISDKLPDQTN